MINRLCRGKHDKPFTAVNKWTSEDIQPVDSKIWGSSLYIEMHSANAENASNDNIQILCRNECQEPRYNNRKSNFTWQCEWMNEYDLSDAITELLQGHWTKLSSKMALSVSEEMT